MINLLLFIIFSTISVQKASTGFAVAIELIEPATRENIKLKVHVKNLTGAEVIVPKQRRDDYKREKIRALGNYVIEIDKWGSDSYQLFTPSADIDPVYQQEEFLVLQNGNTITDTLNISGRLFSRNTESKRGFPTGKYRVRIYFNSDMRTATERNASNHFEFEIE